MKRRVAPPLYGIAVFAQIGALHGAGDASPLRTFGASQLLHNAQGQNARYTGIGRVNASGACTGFLAAIAGGEKAPAVVLTNGHCAQVYYQPRSAFEVVRDEKVEDGNMNVVFNYFADTQDEAIEVPVASIRYSTMKGIDLAVLELAATTEELVNRGVIPIPITDTAPVRGAPIHVVGAPSRITEAFLRESECLEEGIYDLVEWRWHFDGSHRNRCASIGGGSSGSPILDEEGRAYAILNTQFEGRGPPCSVNNPCEVSPTGVAVQEDAVYGSPLVGLRHCFDARGVFRPEAEACPLETTPPLISDTAPETPTRPTDAQGGALTWGASLVGPYARVRTKMGPATSTDCRDLCGYSFPILRDDPRFLAALPDQNGLYFLCILGVADSSETDVRFPMVVVAAIDTTLPTRPEGGRGLALPTARAAPPHPPP